MGAPQILCQESLLQFTFICDDSSSSFVFFDAVLLVQHADQQPSSVARNGSHVRSPSHWMLTDGSYAKQELLF